MNFSDLIGKNVVALVPVFDDKLFSELTIRGVESGGLWVECAKVTQAWMQEMGVPALKTPIFFLPYNEIRFAFAAGELSLSDKAFGVPPQD